MPELGRGLRQLRPRTAQLGQRRVEDRRPRHERTGPSSSCSRARGSPLPIALAERGRRRPRAVAGFSGLLEGGLHRHKARRRGPMPPDPSPLAARVEGVRLGLSRARRGSSPRPGVSASSSAARRSPTPPGALRVLETASPPTFYIPREDVRAELLADADGRPHRLRVEGPRQLPARRGRRRGAPSARPGSTPSRARTSPQLDGTTSPSTPAGSTPPTSTTSASSRRAAASTAAGSPTRSRGPTRESPGSEGW